MVPISVVVPTRERPDSLRRCLAALAAQDAGAVEVLVVDDGSRDRGAVDAAVAGLGPATVLRSPGLGPAAARNIGVRAAAGEIVCLTDDDCEPRPSWARTLAAAARAAPGRVAGGLTLAPPGANAAVRAGQAITNHLQHSSVTRSGALGFAPTCNLAAGRDVLAALPFDPSYPDAAGEDRDWWARALAAGVVAAYEPGAVVTHRQRLGAAALLRQQFRYGRGAARFRRGGGGERGYGDAGFYAGLLRAGLAEGAAAGALVLAAQAATGAGIAVERLSGRRR